MKQIDFHPLANEYPLMPARELGRLEQGMIQWGFDPRFPIVLYQKKILDGRNRYLAAQAAGVKPVYSTFTGSEEDARQFVQKANEERRHLAPEWLERRRAERVARVAEARTEGKSIRTIAAQEGVSVATVHGDIEKATVQGRTVEPESGKSTGLDGKERPASKPAPTPPESKLIPELRCRPWAPRFLPLIEVLDVAQQYAFLARLSVGVAPLQALAEVTEQIKQPEPPAPKPTPKPAKAEREPGDDTDSERREQVGEIRGLLEDCIAQGNNHVMLSKAQAELTLAELLRRPMEFVVPTLAEVTAYCQQRGGKVDPQAWFNHYTANNFKVGRVPMKDWRASVRTWEQDKFAKNGAAPKIKGRLRGEYVEE